jgi:carboxyl-terminal processing protease
MQQLLERHQARTETDPDFIFMRKQVEHLEKQKKITHISLNQDTLQQERETNENWLLSVENERRASLGLPPVKTLAEVDDTLPKDEQGRPINPESEAILAESGEVLLDLIDLTLSHTAALPDHISNRKAME